VPVVITPAARAVIAEEGLAVDLVIGPPITVADMLDLLVARSERLVWVRRDGFVEVTTRAAAGGDAVLCVHDVRDLVFARTEFLPPVIRGIPVGDDEPRTGGEAEERVALVDPDVLVANVELATDPGYWDRDGGGTIEYADGGYLIVVANAAMQRCVARTLGVGVRPGR
jgi:hypothetical protein